jgi:hypothetical protein
MKTATLRMAAVFDEARHRLSMTAKKTAAKTPREYFERCCGCCLKIVIPRLKAEGPLLDQKDPSLSRCQTAASRDDTGDGASENAAKAVFRRFSPGFRRFSRRAGLAILPMNQGSDRFSGRRAPYKSGENGKTVP